MANPTGKRTIIKRTPENQYLSKQQMEIALCIKAGLKNKQISIALDIDQKTVSTHVRRIYDKFGVDRKKNVHYLVRRLEELGKFKA